MLIINFGSSNFVKGEENFHTREHDASNVFELFHIQLHNCKAYLKIDITTTEMIYTYFGNYDKR